MPNDEPRKIKVEYWAKGYIRQTIELNPECKLDEQGIFEGLFSGELKIVFPQLGVLQDKNGKVLGTMTEILDKTSWSDLNVEKLST